MPQGPAHWSCPDHGRDTRKRHVPARRHRQRWPKPAGRSAAPRLPTPSAPRLAAHSRTRIAQRLALAAVVVIAAADPPCGLDGLPATAGCRRPGTRSSGAYCPSSRVDRRRTGAFGLLVSFGCGRHPRRSTTSRLRRPRAVSPAEGGATHRKTPASCRQRRRRQQVCRWRRAPAPAAEVIADVVVQHVQIPPQDSP